MYKKHRDIYKNLGSALPALVLALVLALGACVYRQEITQGSIITPEEVAELELGMSKVQVQFVLGSPSVINPLDENRWEYVLLVRDKKAKVHIGRGYLLFVDERLAEIEMDSYLNEAAKLE